MRVLIVEDESADRDSLKYLLEMDCAVSSGLDVKGASNKEQAISLITSFDPDALVVDLDLTGSKGGDFSGLAVIQTAKQTKGKLIVAYSAYAGDPMVDAALKDLGLTEYCIVSKDRSISGFELEKKRKEESLQVLSALMTSL